MRSDLPLFSVIIPQKDRAEYIIYTLKTCIIQDYPNFQVIVSDDCSEDNSVEVIKEFASKDSRIKLFAHKHHLGMRDNFEFALNQVNSGYVIALGGDDGLTPGCIWRMYDIIKNTGKQLLTWTPATFVYNNMNDSHNIFYLQRPKFDGVKILKSNSYLNKISQTLNYMTQDCPMIYIKGVASIELINRVKSRTKDHSFYYCPTPDGFSGVVLAGEVDEYAFTYEPLSIGGQTWKSQGDNYVRTDEKSRKEAESFFNDNLRRTMHHQLASQPYSPIITLMTADYLLTAKDLPGWPGKFNLFSFEYLLTVTFKNLETNLLRNEVLLRELQILKKIAIQHDLLPLYNRLVHTTKRRVVRSNPVYGFVITKSIRFDGSEIGINNVFDASLATNFVYNFSRKVSFAGFVLFIKNMFRVLLRTRQYKKESLPIID